MKQLILVLIVCTMFSSHAQFKLNKKTVSSGTKVAKALTFTNKDAIKLSADAVAPHHTSNELLPDPRLEAFHLLHHVRLHRRQARSLLGGILRAVRD